MNLADAYSESKETIDKAIELYHKTLTIYKNTIGENHPYTAFNYNSLGTAWKTKEEYEKAIEFYNKALTIKLNTLGDNHPSTIRTQKNLKLTEEKLKNNPQ